MKHGNPTFSDLLRNPVHWLAFGLGSGLAPFAPGTFGTLVAIPIYYLFSGLDLWLYLGVTAAMFLVGVHLCGRTSGDLGVPDHPGIVWDEIVGYLVTMIAAPDGWPWVIAGFVLFRLFDILKPWPIGLADRRIKGGKGIMVDDIIAGLMGAILIHAVAYFMEW